MAVHHSIPTPAELHHDLALGQWPGVTYNVRHTKMRCDSCGKGVPDDEKAMFETRNVQTSAPNFLGAPTRVETFWLCSDCAKYRQTTHRILYWLVGVMLALGAIFIALRAVF